MKGTTLIAATDLSNNAGPAARWAHATGQGLNMPVVAAHIFEIGFNSWWKSKYDVLVDEGQMAAARGRIDTWYREQTGGAPTGGVELRVDDCHSGLTRIVQERDGAILAMAATGKGALTQAIVGSRVQELAARPPCPVAVVHPQPRTLGPGERIVVAIDFSTSCGGALALASEIALRTGATLTALHVAEVPESAALPGLFNAESTSFFQAADAELQRYGDENITNGVAMERVVRSGTPGRCLIDYATENNAALVVLGRTGHRSVIADLLGSVPRALISALPTTVLVTPAIE